jgi:hypothetical protein
MDGFVRDAIIKIGGPLPVIGSALVIAAILGWVAYKAYEDDSKEIAVLLGGLTVGVLIAALFSVPAAKSSCRQLYRTDVISYASSNCEMLVRCYELRGTTC